MIDKHCTSTGKYTDNTIHPHLWKITYSLNRRRPYCLDRVQDPQGAALEERCKLSGRHSWYSTMVDSPRDDATVLFDTVELLLREKLYHSAEIIGGILLSRATMPCQRGQRDLGLHAEALSMFGDALKGRGEHKRATVSSPWNGVLLMFHLCSKSNPY